MIRIALGIILVVMVVALNFWRIFNIKDNNIKFEIHSPLQKAIASTAPTISPLSPLFADSFENGLSEQWYCEMPNNSYSGTVSKRYSIDGYSSLRIELRKSDTQVYDGKRSEISLDANPPLQEYTYSFSILLPKGGEEDYSLDPTGSEIIAQWHNTPDPGEPWTTPPLALRTFHGHYVLDRCWDDAPITSNEQMTQKGQRASYDLGSYENDKGKFINWKFHVKWGWLDQQHPFLEVYKDDEEILRADGPNTTNDKVGVLMKLGIYKWDWSQTNDTSILTRRVIYYDNVKIERNLSQFASN